MRTKTAVVALGVAVVVNAVGPTAGLADAPTPEPLVAAADAAEPATRGTAVQQTPPPEVPSWADPAWQTGRISGCVPGRVVRSVNTGGERLVTFTFDDGPDPLYSVPIMDAFSERGLTATFFLIGRNLRSFPEIGRSMVQRGFAVGNHSMTHSYKPADIAREIPTTNNAIWSVLGVRTPYFRSPGLVSARSIDAAASRAGLCSLSAAVDLGDYVLPRRSAADLCARFAAALVPGMIVLLHDGGGSHGPTAAAVPCMLDTAIARGYRIVSLAELLNAAVS